MAEDETRSLDREDVERSRRDGAPDAGFDERGVAERGEGGVGRRRRRRSRGRRTIPKEEAERPRSFTPEQRLMLLDVWQRSELPAKDFSELSGVSAHSLYTWRKKFEAEGPAGLVGLKRGRPKGSRLPEPTKRAILLLKRLHEDWGRDRIHDELLRAEGLEASPGAIGKVLEEAGYVVEGVRTKPHPPPVKRFERARPNQLWQSDLFTFLLRRQNRRVYLVGFLDDCSRFLVGLALSATSSGALVRGAFEAAVASHGLPEEVLTDRGPQYATWRGKSAFRRLLDRRGVKHIVSRPRHPQTLGKIERFWKTIWGDLLHDAVFHDLEDARVRIQQYVDHYNFSRPHQALDGAVPADRFFEAEPEVKAALKKRVKANALEMARGGKPRKPFYLTGRVGDQPLSLHAEGERVVLVKEDGQREEVDLVAAGWRGMDDESGDGTEPVARGVEALDEGLREREEADRRWHELERSDGDGTAEEEDGTQPADGPGGGAGKSAGDEARGGDRGDALGAVEPDGDERGPGDLAEPVLPAGDAGASGAGFGAGAPAPGPDADPGAGAGSAQSRERSASEGASSLPGADADGAAHDRACEAGPGEGRIDDGDDGEEDAESEAAGSREGGAQDAPGEGARGAGGSDDGDDAAQGEH